MQRTILTEETQKELDDSFSQEVQSLVEIAHTPILPPYENHFSAREFNRIAVEMHQQYEGIESGHFLRALEQEYFPINTHRAIAQYLHDSGRLALPHTTTDLPLLTSIDEPKIDRCAHIHLTDGSRHQATYIAGIIPNPHRILYGWNQEQEILIEPNTVSLWDVREID